MIVVHYLALLRGINVGGNNIIKMKDLKECFEHMGFQNVETYIQSGNVLFASTGKNIGKITQNIEKTLSQQFNYQSRVVVVPHDILTDIVKHAPKGFGAAPAKYRYNVMFLMPEISAREVVKQISVKEGVDQVWAGKQVVYFSRLISRAVQSNLPRIIKLPMYRSMTIRNWNTTTKLLVMMGDRIK